MKDKLSIKYIACVGVKLRSCPLGDCQPSHSECCREVIVEFVIMAEAADGAVYEAIQKAMTEKGITTDEIPRENQVNDPSIPDSINRSKRYFRVRGFARFREHDGCRRTWASVNGWAVMDLKQQVLCYRYSEECRSCKGSSQPNFDNEALAKMANWATDKYLERCGRLRRSPLDMSAMQDSLPTRGPHDMDRCEMCRRLGRECWQ